MQKVLIIGGTGRIGQSVAKDILSHTDAHVIITGRQVGQTVADKLGSRATFQALDLANYEGLKSAVAAADLVIHTAGPFHDRNAQVLQLCIDNGVNYLDVSDHRSFTNKAVAYREDAIANNVTAIINTGVFPGISNSMVRQDVEALDQAEHIHLSYVVAGSGGAGLTVMRTTFLGLQNTFDVWRSGQWVSAEPYSKREVIHFPKPYGPVNVFWFDVPEALTLAQSFDVQTVITKFGSVPEIYNVLTWLTARLPKALLRKRSVIEFFSWGSYRCTEFSDRFTGTGVAMRSEVKGLKDGKPTTACSTLVVDDTAIAAGYGTGSIAQLILSGQFSKPGVWPVEASFPTDLCQSMLKLRGVNIEQQIFN
ncbi:Lysine 6-dehydrogenase [Acaryochloris thomasi RCC1774]|uniref:Lysine 6-dehydrogenase n=1 Tax=Acaryochloris thomasi RCC1774 TaxID=1764569 RepID=A0A2W1JKS4_9CYAN|nr:saccharopine dehydrogenase NADP-binding domain-containing protein [Acaryochloris thomasi]PZD73796.1 Lysine 6-dehydrogenase [Acaryochloris thomasi RCC1774]